MSADSIGRRLYYLGSCFGEEARYIAELLSEIQGLRCFNMSSEESLAKEKEALEEYAISGLAGQTVREHVLDVGELERFTEELRDGSDQNFERYLTLRMDSCDDKLKDDDLKREESFLQSTLTAAEEGLRLLIEKKIPFRRPDDYMAEMIKSDEHMQKVRSQLSFEKERIDAAVRRRAERDNTKNTKKRQRQKEQERKKREKDEVLGLEQARKGRLKAKQQARQSGGKGEGDLEDNDDLSTALFQDGTPIPPRKKRSGRNENRSAPNGKQKFRSKSDSNKPPRDRKFNGGIQKQKPQRNGPKKKFGAKKRPGKDRRNQMKNKR
ncbi:hypothetical protein NDN08_006783 [Rhodosorus marinus]|uniref:rRNA-processing protein EBP2 n=1 Tax=Rhodosorus marinus TaxID=101924 RepID=A0AAV8UIP2_9RHOD|nr:hypothetical protein NDN08_006783 [Rhodosorus marinus]